MTWNVLWKDCIPLWGTTARGARWAQWRLAFLTGEQAYHHRPPESWLPVGWQLNLTILPV